MNILRDNLCKIYVKKQSIKYLVNYSIFGYITLVTFYMEYCEESIYMNKLG